MLCLPLLPQATFDPFLKNFYVLSTDPTHIKMLKLEVLTNIANETNVHTVMREFRVSVEVVGGRWGEEGGGWGRESGRGERKGGRLGRGRREEREGGERR